MLWIHQFQKQMTEDGIEWHVLKSIVCSIPHKCYSNTLFQIPNKTPCHYTSPPPLKLYGTLELTVNKIVKCSALHDSNLYTSCCVCTNNSDHFQKKVVSWRWGLSVSYIQMEEQCGLIAWRQVIQVENISCSLDNVWSRSGCMWLLYVKV